MSIQSTFNVSEWNKEVLKFYFCKLYAQTAKQHYNEKPDLAVNVIVGMKMFGLHIRMQKVLRPNIILTKTK